MPAWPTDINPRSNTEPTVPGPQIAVSQSGKVNVRATTQIGRVWRNVYFGDVRENNFRKLMATVRNFMRAGTSFTIIHQDHATPKGTYGGSPLVAGADQTGSTINLDAASTGITNWHRAGDLVTFANITPTYEVTADGNSDGGGLVALPISPPIFSGGSPADNAPLTTTGVTITAIVVAADFPESNASDFGILTVTFEETP